MGLFDQVIRAIDDPNQEANPGQVNGILDTVQQMASSRGVNSSATQTILSVVGSHVRSALQQKRNVAGSDQAEAIVNQYSGTRSNPEAVRSLFTPQQQQQVIQEVAQRTGLNANTIQAMLPILIPLVLNLLRTGASAQNSSSGQNSPASNRSNSVLNTFLDADSDGDVDVGDAMSLAGRYFSQAR